MYQRRGWWTCALAAALLTTATAASAQHRPASALNWAFGGAVHTVARVGHVAFVGGRFNAVAARHNVTGGFAVVSPLTSQRALRAVRVHGNVNAIVPDGGGGWFVAATSRSSVTSAGCSSRTSWLTDVSTPPGRGA